MPADRTGCADFRRALRPDRRGFVTAGLLGAAGLGLADVLRAAETRGLTAHGSPGQPSPSRTNTVILLWMRGGPSHIDMWDPKPDAPAEYRGEFKTIPTNVPGIQFTDVLPLSARMADKFSVVRSLNHHDAGHSTGDQICFTGYNSGPAPDENVHPSIGSVVSKQLGHLNPSMPAYVMIPRLLPGAGSAERVPPRARTPLPGYVVLVRGVGPAARHGVSPGGVFRRAGRASPRASPAASQDATPRVRRELAGRRDSRRSAARPALQDPARGQSFLSELYTSPVSSFG